MSLSGKTGKYWTILQCCCLSYAMTQWAVEYGIKVDANGNFGCFMRSLDNEYFTTAINVSQFGIKKILKWILNVKPNFFKRKNTSKCK